MKKRLFMAGLCLLAATGVARGETSGTEPPAASAQGVTPGTEKSTAAGNPATPPKTPPGALSDQEVAEALDQVKKASTPARAAPAAGEPAPAGKTVVEQPAPLAAIGDEGDEGDDRNPFATPAGRKLFSADYGKGVDGCRLAGLLRVAGRRMGLFAVAAAGGGKQAGAKERVLRVEVGDEIRFFAEDTEYVFTVRSLGERSAVLVGENKGEYKVWL